MINVQVQEDSRLINFQMQFQPICLHIMYTFVHTRFVIFPYSLKVPSANTFTFQYTLMHITAGTTAHEIGFRDLFVHKNLFLIVLSNGKILSRFTSKSTGTNKFQEVILHQVF